MHVEICWLMNNGKKAIIHGEFQGLHETFAFFKYAAIPFISPKTGFQQMVVKSAKRWNIAKMAVQNAHDSCENAQAYQALQRLST
jgi:hypothetical protein